MLCCVNVGTMSLMFAGMNSVSSTTCLTEPLGEEPRENGPLLLGMSIGELIKAFREVFFMNWRIKASDVAAIIGANPYRTREDVLNEYTGLGTNSEREFQKALVEEAPDVQKVVLETIERSKIFDLDAKKEVAALPESVKEYVTHEVYKNNGTQREKRTQKTHDVTPDKKRYTMKITEDVTLVGYIDGRKEDRIVEIKNRQNRLFNKVPKYEWVQCQVYMKLTGIPKCTLIEQYGEKSNSFDLEFSDTSWEVDILPRLREFAWELVENNIIIYK